MGQSVHHDGRFQRRADYYLKELPGEFAGRSILPVVGEVYFLANVADWKGMV